MDTAITLFPFLFLSFVFFSILSPNLLFYFTLSHILPPFCPSHPSHSFFDLFPFILHWCFLIFLHMFLTLVRLSTSAACSSCPLRPSGCWSLFFKGSTKKRLDYWTVYPETTTESCWVKRKYVDRRLSESRRGALWMLRGQIRSYCRGSI